MIGGESSAILSWHCDRRLNATDDQHAPARPRRARPARPVPPDLSLAAPQHRRDPDPGARRAVRRVRAEPAPRRSLARARPGGADLYVAAAARMHRLRAADSARPVARGLRAARLRRRAELAAR